MIVGGTSGIGLATARLMLERGARVLITGRTKSTLDSAREELGENAIVVRSDAASLPDIEALARSVESEFETFDVLFANAGVTRQAPLESMSEATYDEVLTVNAKGPYHRAEARAADAQGGAVVLTTSVSDSKGLPTDSAYAASKAALRSMARTFARELAPRGIRVNAVSPGPTDTGILEQAMPRDAADQTKREMSKRNPMGRFGRPQEVAEAVAFLAFGATFTTGAEFAVDGGVSQL